MKKSCFLFLFSLLFFSSKSNAQQIFYSKIEKFTFQKSDFKAIGWCGDRLYTYRSSREGFFLDAYNDSMRLMATVALDFFPDRTYGAEFYITNANEIVVLYQTTQGNNLFQYGALLDSKARMLQSPVVLDSVRTSWVGAGKSNFSSVISRDKSKVIVFGMSKRKSNRQEIRSVLIDSKLNVLKTGTTYIENDEELDLGQSILANDGTFFFSAFNGAEGKTLSGDVWLFKMSANGEELKNIQMPLQKNFMAGTYLRINDNTNEIYVTAFYSDKKHGDNLGLVYGTYSLIQDTLSSFKWLPFDDDLRASTDIRNRKKAFNDLEIRNVIVKSDGGFVLVAENYYISTRTTNNANMMGYYSWYNSYGYGPSTSTREYNYGDVMVVSFDGTGKKVWSNFIRKDQYSQDDGGMFSSFATLNSGGSLVFLFNNFTTSRSAVNLASIDADGGLHLKKLNQGDVAGLDWIPRAGKQIGALEFLIPVLKKNSLGFVRVAFN